MTGRFRHGLAVIDASLDVFRARPRLALLPLLSVGVVGTAYAAIALVVLHYGLLGAVFSSKLAQYGAMFVVLGISSSIGIFFNAAVVHCAARHFDGEEPTVREGLAAAWAVRRELLVWGLISATIGTGLHIAEDTVPGVGTVTQWVLDMAWGLLTFFLIPVIVMDRTGSFRSDLRQSGAAFSRTWGESITATFGIGLALLPVGVLGCGLLGAALLSGPGATGYALAAVGGALLVAAIVVTQVLGMIVRTALYRYAADGERVGPLTDLEPDRVFAND